ncbi:MAG: hypothetical protein IT210_24550 [Armatimonadetes bacterium]|nr:hypothetical protein [Armatimonadota bacterium]
MQADLSGLDLSDPDFQELYYNDKRQPMARVPNFDPSHPRSGGWAYNAEVVEKGSLTRFRYRPEEVCPSRWRHPEQAVAVFYSAYNYNNTISRIKRIDLSAREFEVEQGCYPMETDDRFYICNLFEELDAPREWCVDRERKILYFRPPDGRLKRSKVAIPVAESAFLLQGGAKAGVSVTGVTVSGIAFRDFRGTVIKMSGASRCAVTASAFRNMMTAVYLGDETHACRAAWRDITQTGGSAIEIAGSPGEYHRASGHEIDNNYI